MFSGIVEAISEIKSSQTLQNAYRIQVQKPVLFDDLHLGDSIAVDGVCLTIEDFNSETMTFALAAETIHVLHWNPARWIGKKINLERSLRFGDRIHGHLVTGHVDSLATVMKAQLDGESFFLEIEIAEAMRPYVWKKGSIALNGVSLTVNEVQNAVVSVCLIPETLRRTNLGLLTLGDFVNVEPDYMAKAVVASAIAWRQNEL